MMEKNLEIVLDFVERWNKSDKEVRVANAHHELEKFLEDKKLKLIEDNEDKLRDIHAKDYMGTDDDMSDNFDSWLSNLSLSELKNLLI